jgi:hypothetical protein
MKPRTDDEGTEKMIVQTINEVHDLYNNITQFNRKFESILFHSSLAKLLPLDNMGIVLTEDTIRALIAGGLFPHTKGVIYNNIVQAGNQSESSVQIRKLWQYGPLFCLINDEVENTTLVFRTPYFP